VIRELALEGEELTMNTQEQNQNASDLAMNGPITCPMVIREDDGVVRGAMHRGDGRRSKHFGFFDREHGIAWRVGMSVYTHERMNPRHKHCFDQIRYYVRGVEKYGRDIFGPGDCVYFPEGVPYGPQTTADGYDENVRIGMQFSGPAAIYYPHLKEIKKAQDELSQIGRFEKGLYVAPDGHKKDSFETIYERITGQEFKYPSPRYENYVAMHTANYTWEPLDGVRGVTVKHLGYFNEIGPNVKLVKIDAGAATPEGTAQCQQVRIVLEGDVTYQGETYNSISCMYFPARTPYLATSSRGGATLLVVQRAGPDGSRPPFCLI